MTIAASATTVRASTGVTPGLASSAKAGVGGDSRGSGGSVGDCSVGNGDHGSIGDSCVCACSVGGDDGIGSISDGSDDDTGGNCGDCGGDGSDDDTSGNCGDCGGDGSDDDTSGNCGDCGGGNVSKGFWNPRRKSNASVAFADRAGKPRPKRSVSTDARAINIAQ